ncbi:MAG: hypothetical protein ABW178_11505 [Pseudoxanthomonas sp.]
MEGYAIGHYTGVEFEASGKLSEHTDVLFGYTHLKMDGNNDSRT